MKVTTIPCKDCICLPLCIGKVIIKKDEEYLFGYHSWGIIDLTKKCPLIRKYDFVDLKEFFLLKKGFTK